MNKSKAKKKAKHITEALVNDMGFYKAKDYAQRMLETIPLDEYDIEGDFKLLTLWEEVYDLVNKWEERG